MAYIASNFELCEEFFSNYYERGGYVGELISALITGWSEFGTVATESARSTPHATRILAFLQLLSHAWPAIALQAQAVLLTDMSQDYHIIALSPLMLANKHCRAVLGSSDVPARLETHAM